MSVKLHLSCTVIGGFSQSESQMIFDPAFKQWRLFKSQCLFPIIHLSKVECQVLAPVHMSLIAWLEANMFTKVGGF